MIELRIEKLRFTNSRCEVAIMASESNHLNPVTNHQCNFGKLLFNANRAQIQNVSRNF